MTASQPPPAPPPAPPPRAEPATKDDLRGIRRWLLVAGVWAVAATAIAVIALVKANDNGDTAKIGKQTAAQIGQVQKDLNKRLDEVEGRLNDFAPSSDVAKLDQRLKKVENELSKTTSKLDKVSAQVDDLKTKVDDLESQQQSSGTDTTQTNTTP